MSSFPSLDPDERGCRPRGGDASRCGDRRRPSARSMKRAGRVLEAYLMASAEETSACDSETCGFPRWHDRPERRGAGEDFRCRRSARRCRYCEPRRTRFLWVIGTAVADDPATHRCGSRDWRALSDPDRARPPSRSGRLSRNWSARRATFPLIVLRVMQDSRLPHMGRRYPKGG